MLDFPASLRPNPVLLLSSGFDYKGADGDLSQISLRPSAEPSVPITLKFGGPQGINVSTALYAYGIILMLL